VYDLHGMPIDSERARARLAALYASMPLPQLQGIASDPMSLTEIARTALQAELRSRGVSDATPEEAADTESRKAIESAPDPPRLVLLCRYRDLHEALMAKGTLDSAGIESFMADENTVSIDWTWSNAIGGVKFSLARKTPLRLRTFSINQFRTP